MPSSILLNTNTFISVLAIYGATVAFGRWFPTAADLIATEAHPSTYTPTFVGASESALTMYAVSLAVDIVRTLALAALESTAFSFAFTEAIFEPFSYAFFAFNLVAVTKDFLMLGLIFNRPEVNLLAADKIKSLWPLSLQVEQGFMVLGLVCLARGLYQWTYAIGRDKRQVITEKEKKSQ
ncbi:hypothetical protein BG000_011378 [Podila horticola]|nr:hypothetical protein BG000_011378 [Podila horticola]